SWAARPRSLAVLPTETEGEELHDLARCALSISCLPAGGMCQDRWPGRSAEYQGGPRCRAGRLYPAADPLAAARFGGEGQGAAALGGRAGSVQGAGLVGAGRGLSVRTGAQAGRRVLSQGPCAAPDRYTGTEHLWRLPVRAEALAGGLRA